MYLRGPNLYTMKHFFTLLAACSSLFAVAQPAGWSFVVPLDITNPNGVQVTNYQVGITVNTAVFPALRCIITGSNPVLMQPILSFGLR